MTQNNHQALLVKGGWKVAISGFALLFLVIILGVFVGATPALLFVLAYRLGYVALPFEQLILIVIALQIGGYVSLMALYHASVPERLFAAVVPWVIDQDQQVRRLERRRCAEVARQASREYSLESGNLNRTPRQQAALIEAAWACELLARRFIDMGDE